MPLRAVVLLRSVLLGRSIFLVRFVLLGSILSLVLWACDASPPPEGGGGQVAPEDTGNAGAETPPPHPGATHPIRVEDDAGHTVVLEGAPIRVVSLVPSATEILLALGQQDRLVGRTDFDEDPALASVPSVGGGLEPSIERIVSLHPDLVVHFRADSDLTTSRQLDRAGIPHVAIRPDGIRDVHRIIRLLGAIVHRDATADSLDRALTARVEGVSRSVAELDRPRVAFLLGGDPPLVAGPGTFLDELIQIAGGQNVFADLGALYAPVNVEEVIRRDPRYLLAREGARISVALAGIPVLRFPPEVEAPGLGLGDSAHMMAGALHPGRLP
ncbi:MAG: hypothetical protein EXR92_03015 [Gemmatimonadetes bacterium]|nr:hypothetical protein [Gemmatimonadota bacterium]